MAKGVTVGQVRQPLCTFGRAVAAMSVHVNCALPHGVCTIFAVGNAAMLSLIL
jgi:hypothetical protein